MANKRSEAEKVKLLTPEFRLGFEALFEARGFKPEDVKKKFSAQMLFQLTETEESKAAGTAVVSIDALKKLCADVAIAKWGPREKWPEVTQVIGGEVGKLMFPFRSGMEPGKKDRAGFGPGIVFANATANNKPGLVHPYKDEATGKPAVLSVPSDLKGGDYGRATINAYAWEYAGKMGVSLGLQNFQKLRDGEAIGGRANADDDFGSIEQPGGAQAAATGAPAAQATAPAPAPDQSGVGV